MLGQKNAFDGYMNEVNSVMKTSGGGNTYNNSPRLDAFASIRNKESSFSPKKESIVILTNLTDIYSKKKTISRTLDSTQI